MQSVCPLIGRGGDAGYKDCVALMAKGRQKLH